MRIKEITSQTRRDFYAIYICEHCGSEEKGHGYDDDYFHNNVIPKKACKACGKSSPETYKANATKYHESETV